MSRTRIVSWGIIWLVWSAIAIAQSTLPLPNIGAPFDGAYSEFDEPFERSIQLPTDAKKSIGVNVNVTVNAWQLPGYGAIHLSLSSATPATAQQNYIIEFDSQTPGMSPPNRGTITRVPIRLDQDSTATEMDVSIPCYGLCRRIAVRFIAQGASPPGYQTSIRTPYDTVDDPINAYLRSQTVFNSATLADIQAPSLGASLTPSNFDTMVIESLDEIDGDPHATQRVADYVLRGGLVVFRQPTTREAVEKSLGIELVQMGRDRLAKTKNFDVLDGPMASGMASYSVGTGQLVWPFADAMPVPLENHDSLASAMIWQSPLRMSSAISRGVDPMLGDARFSQWLVPGVAQPPVYTFMGLLAAFVILVGPIAYRKTTRSGRGYLMFAIAPLLAIVTTACMFGYGIIADGFGTIVRVRQLTYVDGTSGDASERSRVTYFAGIRPSDGISFPANTEVYPYHETLPTESWETQANVEPERMGTIRIDNSTQRFDASFLPSRRQQQFVCERLIHDIGSVELVPAGIDGDPPRIHNRMTFDLRRLIIHDRDNRYWLCDHVAAGSLAVTNPPGDQSPNVLMGGLYNDFRAISEVRQSRSNGINRGLVDLVATINGMIGGRAVQVEGAFEAHFLDLLKNDGDLPPNFFVGISDPSSDMVGVEGAKVQESVRYVYGTMR